MNQNEPISSLEFMCFWDRVLKEQKVAMTVEKRSRFCAVMGHISFHGVLAALSFFLSIALCRIEEKLIPRPWYTAMGAKITELGDKFGAFLLHGTEVPVVLIYILCALISLIVIPFAICVISRIFSVLMRGRICKRPIGDEYSEVNLKHAKTMQDAVSKTKRAVSTTRWDDYYPMDTVEDDLVEFNRFNYIPFLTGSVPMIIGMIVGTHTDDIIVYLGGALLAFIFSALALLITVPLWKLSSIVNSLLYHSRKQVRLDDIEDTLRDYIQKNTPKEAPKSTYQSSSTYDPPVVPSSSTWSPDKGLKTFMTDGRNMQDVYYKDGQYVNEDGERVPIQWIVE